MSLLLLSLIMTNVPQFEDVTLISRHGAIVFTVERQLVFCPSVRLQVVFLCPPVGPYPLLFLAKGMRIRRRESLEFG